jgi:hypothetical protein
MKNLQFLLFLFLSGGPFYCSGTDQSGNLNQCKEKSFKVFWIEFREAVLKNDTTQLINLTHFPLKIHGELDEDSILLIHENSFFSFFKKFLLRKSYFPDGETNFNDIKSITHYDYIISIEIPENAGIFQETESWQRVGDLEFEKINNEWKLALVYFPYRD